MKKILDKLKEYLDVPAVTNHTQPFLKYLYKDFSKFDDYELILSENILIVRKKENRSNKIISAHIDRLGLVMGDHGAEHSNFWGKKKHGIKIETGLEIFDRMALAFKDEYFIPYNVVYDELKLYRDVKVKYVKTDFVDYLMEFVFQKGNREFEGKEGIAFMLKNNFFFDGHRIGGQIDNAICVATIYQLIKDGFDGTALFTCREEIGLSWKYIVEYLEDSGIETDKLIVLDTTPYPDSSYFENGKVVFRRADKNGEFNVDFMRKIKRIARKNNIPYATKIPKGNTELGRIVQHTKGKFNGTTLQIPSTNYHSNKEMTNADCLKNYYKLLKLALWDDKLFE